MRVFRAITVVVAAAAVAMFVSFTTVRFLLGFGFVGVEDDPFRQIRALRPDVRDILAFASGGELRPGDITNFAQAMGVSLDALSANKPSTLDFVSIDEVERLNPNPAVHRNEHYPFWISLGYRSEDNRYHQITWYGGEADGLPSPLVWKRSPGSGDFYVRYTVQLSRETGTVHHPLTTGAVRVDALEWQAYDDLSYDGLEEMGFSILGTIILGPILVILGLKVLQRRLSDGTRPFERSS
jgi:hypothetical protein